MYTDRENIQGFTSVELLLMFQAIFFYFDLITCIPPQYNLIPALRRMEKAMLRMKPLANTAIPLLLTILGLIYAPVMLTDLDPDHYDMDETCAKQGVDADLAGDGVRVAAWAQIIILLILCFAGMFQRETTGVKEIGAGLALTHFSLNIAMLVQLAQHKLSTVDAVIGCMILDAQNMALSMQLTSKETLASTWQVLNVILTQLFGLCVIAAIMANVLDNSLDPTDCQCLAVFWWAWVGSCFSLLDDKVVFWMYYTFRLLNFLHSSMHSAIKTDPFHKSKRNPGGRMSHTRGRVLHTIRARFKLEEKFGLNRPAFFTQYSSTLTATYTTYGVFSIVSMTTAELAMRRLELRPTAGLTSVGQIIALAVAGATVVRVIWQSIMLSYKRIHMKDGATFGWPFHMREVPVRRVEDDDSFVEDTRQSGDSEHGPVVHDSTIN
ncbi:hypothetical protein FBEOM_12958 [Fusarium beomiforme]|uniref:Uncharacterized protein n=1 Tax=Fusarium beomiforme TaxID=44412 RepID=A0A9P5DSW4_9HYPO|nr:hypothetical protein FBEOM_12958 [Fusarium beomiforme]